MKILITGANGFLGQHLTLFLAQKNFEVIACSRGLCRIPAIAEFSYHSIDLTDVNAVTALVESANPDVLVHTAANSKPDDCESNKENCLLQNIETTRYLLNASKKLKSIHFIYISTDFIFGENGPHSEDDMPAPLNFYGESKLLAEQLVCSSDLPYTILRPVFIYGQVWEGLRSTFLHWVKTNLEQGKKIKVVSDQYRTPTFVTDICIALERMISERKEGVYHIAGKEIISPYEMALAVARFLLLDEDLIESVTSETFKEPVKRAKRSGLKIDKAVKALNFDPTNFKKGIELTFKENYDGYSS